MVKVSSWGRQAMETKQNARYRFYLASVFSWEKEEMGLHDNLC